MGVLEDILNRFDIMKYNMDVRGIIHVGAYIGEESVLYDAMKVKDVIWIEPNPDIYKELLTIDKEGYRFYNIAVDDSEEENTKMFNVTGGPQSSSLLNLKLHAVHYPGNVVYKRIPVTCMSLDLLFQKEKLDPRQFNMINMDVQGAELLVLKGMNTLMDHIDYVYTEVNFVEMYEDCALIEELDEFLSDFDRVETFVTQNRYKGWGDALYIRRK